MCGGASAICPKLIYGLFASKLSCLKDMGPSVNDKKVFDVSRIGDLVHSGLVWCFLRKNENK